MRSTMTQNQIQPDGDFLHEARASRRAPHVGRPAAAATRPTVRRRATTARSRRGPHALPAPPWPCTSLAGIRRRTRGTGAHPESRCFAWRGAAPTASRNRVPVRREAVTAVRPSPTSIDDVRRTAGPDPRPVRARGMAQAAPPAGRRRGPLYRRPRQPHRRDPRACSRRCSRVPSGSGLRQADLPTTPRRPLTSVVQRPDGRRRAGSSPVSARRRTIPTIQSRITEPRMRGEQREPPTARPRCRGRSSAGTRRSARRRSR